MRVLDGWFLLVDSKYPTPSVFDLHSRGWFHDEPAVIHRYGARMLVNNRLEISIEYRYLIKKGGVENGRSYSYQTIQGIIPLGREHDLDLTRLGELIDNIDARLEVNRIYDQWCEQSLPKGENNDIDHAALAAKLRSSLEESKKQVRKELKRRNGSYVAARVPALVGSFFRWQEGTLTNEVFEEYCAQGGEEPEKGLLQKIAEFYTICDTTEPGGLIRADGKIWESEDEIWECWVGFAGSEDEARRVCLSMNTVLRQ
jgi:hypothetical protein